jgi:TonB family protein
MIYRISLIISLLFFLQVYGQKYLSGIISTNTIWQGEIYIDGDVTIPQGIVLTVIEGTKVYFKPQTDSQKSGKDKQRSEIIVNGILRAKSNNSLNPIVFTSASNNPQMNDWYGIVVKNFFDLSEFVNCIIEFGYKGLTCYGSSPIITGCEIRFNHNSGISCEVKSNPLISKVLIFGNGFAGINCELASNPQISGCTILENNFGIMIFSKSAPDIGTFPVTRDKSPGENRISNNFEHDVYNHSSNTIYAQNNTWMSNNPQEIRNVIFDRVNNSSYGEVIYQPVYVERRRPYQYTALIASNNPAYSRDSANQNQTDTLSTELPASINSTSLQPAPDTLLANLVTKKEIPLVTQPGREERSLSYAGNVSSTSENLGSPVNEPILEAFLDAGKREYIQRINPVYPKIYLQTGTQGDVLIQVIIGFTGNVEDYRVLKSDGELFTEAAEAALRKFRYKPGKFNGQAVRFKIIERFRFKLN